MNCPNCQSPCGENDRFCYHCGAPLQTAAPKKKGTHLVPLLLLTVLSVVGIILFFAIPLGETVSETPWFTVQNGTLYFDKSLYEGSSELTIPDVIDGQVVTQISDRCFENCTSLTTVILPDTVKTIGMNAFSGCAGLRGIFLPEGLTHIGIEAFLGCSNLEAICIPSTTASIGRAAFSGCTELSYILFSGSYSQWEPLYSEHITLHTHVYCTDGTYLHR